MMTPSGKGWSLALAALSGLLAAMALVSFFLARQPAGATPSEAGAGLSGTTPDSGTAAGYEQGKALFLDKGCVRCHRHEMVADLAQSLNVGPDLTGLGDPSSGLPSDPDYLRSWLKDPRALRPNTAMPDLDLSEEEIDGLLAFLLAGPPDAPSDSTQDD